MLQLGPHLKKLQNYGGFIKIHPLDRELCSIEGCQSYICVSLTVDAKVPLAQRELLVEVPSLRVMLLSEITVKLFLGGDSRQRSESRDFRVLSGQQRSLLSKCRLHHEPWTPKNFIKTNFM